MICCALNEVKFQYCFLESLQEYELCATNLMFHNSHAKAPNHHGNTGHAGLIQNEAGDQEKGRGHSSA